MPNLTGLPGTLGSWWTWVLAVFSAGVFPVVQWLRKSRVDEGAALLSEYKSIDAIRAKDVTELREELRHEREERKKVERELDVATDEIRDLKRRLGAQDEVIAGLRREMTQMAASGARLAGNAETENLPGDMEELVGRLHHIRGTKK